MKKIKGILSILLIVILVFGFAGCSKDNNSDSGADTSKGTSTDEGNKELEHVNLTWYYPGSYPFKDQELVFAEANKIIKEKINATVEFKALPWGEYEDKMRVVMGADEDYDIAFTSNWFNNYHSNVAMGAYLPLNDLLPKYAPTLYKSVPEKFWEATKVDGQIYGLVNYQISARTAALNMKKENVEKLGIAKDTVFDSIDDLEPYLEKAKGIFPPDMIPILSEWRMSLQEAVGQEWIAGASIPGAIYLNDKNAKVFNQFKSEEFKKHVERNKIWAEKGYLGGDALFSAKDTGTFVNQGKVIFSVGGTWKPGVDEEETARRGYEFWVKPLSDAYVTTGGIIATMHAINSNSKNPERAMMLMELMNTDVELYNIIAYGIEGTHYNKLEDGTVEVIPDAGYNPGTLWLHASTFNAHIMKGMPLDVWEQTKKINLEAQASPLLGFSFNPESVSAEMAQCESVVNEFIKSFDFGVGDVDSLYEKFVEKLDKAGAQTITDEIQRQIDEWMGK